jgi:hypothetical protein
MGRGMVETWYLVVRLRSVHDMKSQGAFEFDMVRSTFLVFNEAHNPDTPELTHLRPSRNQLLPTSNEYYDHNWEGD